MKRSDLSETFAVILAGGSGTRFWPMSRELRPKQLLPLFGEGETMLEQTVSRLEGLVARENILLLTNGAQEDAVRKVIGERLPAENILVEPESRDTAPAIALGTAWVAARNPDAAMMVVPSDQWIPDTSKFQQTMKQAVDVASREKGIVTIGIRPTFPCTAYGYIQRGSCISSQSGEAEQNPVFEVESFREKPNESLAREFLEQGGFCWNSGIFVWPVPAVIEELRQHGAELAAFIEELQEVDDFHRAVAERFSSLPKISIDYALMEKASRVYNIEASFQWDDLGSWISAGRHFPVDEYDNACKAAVSSVDSTNNVVYTEGDTHVALLGVHDLVVVQTPDAILVVSKKAVDGMKNLVEKVPDYLK